jgi:hypothetical protein
MSNNVDQGLLFTDRDKKRTIQESFELFHEEHPEVYKELVKLARIRKLSGKSKCGIKTLWEVMRWQFELKTPGDEEFKLNNNFHSRYVRMICANEPDLATMFEMRKLKAA